MPPPKHDADPCLLAVRFAGYTVTHKPNGTLPLLSVRSAVTFSIVKEEIVVLAAGSTLPPFTNVINAAAAMRDIACMQFSAADMQTSLPSPTCGFRFVNPISVHAACVYGGLPKKRNTRNPRKLGVNF